MKKDGNKIVGEGAILGPAKHSYREGTIIGPAFASAASEGAGNGSGEKVEPIGWDARVARRQRAMSRPA